MSDNVRSGRPVMLRRSQEPSWAEAVSFEAWLQIAIVAALFVLAYWREILRLTEGWKSPDWTHGWLIPLISLYIVHVNRERLWRIPIRPSLLGVPIMLGAAGIYLWAILHIFGYPRPFSMLIMIAGIVTLMGGWRLALASWFPIVLLIFAIPLPQLKYTEMTFPLRRIVTTLATGALNLLPNVFAKAEAMTIDYYRGSAHGTLDVAEACSGMRLLMAFLAMGAIMAYLMRERSVWHRLALLALCFPIAIFCNFVRVTTTGILQVYGYQTFAKGGAHAALGLLMMLLALGLFGGANWVLCSLVTDTDGDEEQQPVKESE